MRDVAKIAEGLSRPGIDPRDFAKIAIVDAVSVGDDGVYLDVRQIPDGNPETVAVSPPYGGRGYGLHLPVDIDEEVVVTFPGGAPDAGGRAVGRTWDKGYRPPQEAIDHPDDVVLVVKPGQRLHVVVSGGGDAVIETRDGGRILHGDEDADDPVIRLSDIVPIVNKLNSLIAKHNTHVHPGVTTGLGSTLVTVSPETPVAQPGGSPVTFTR